MSAVSSTFAFEPTVRQNAPDGLELRILAEVGNAGEASLDVVMASYEPDRTPALRLELWTFDQRDKDKLEPKGPRRWLLPLTTADSPEGLEDLPRLRRALVLPNSIVTRPVGLAGASATEALAQLGTATRTLRATDATPTEQLDAAATMFRGLADEVALSPTVLPRLVDALAAGAADGAPVDQASTRRVSVTTRAVGEAPSFELEMIEKPSGWTITRAVAKKG